MGLFVKVQKLRSAMSRPFKGTMCAVGIGAFLAGGTLLCGCQSLPLGEGLESVSVAKPSIPSLSINLEDFGGVGDGRTLNTDAFERAFDQLEKQGGGRLVVPAGIWLTGPICLRSHTDLHLDAGALIQFSGDHTLYPMTVINMGGEKSIGVVSPILGEHLEDVAITGAGVIDGAGEAWRPLKKAKVTEKVWNQFVQSGGVLNEKNNVWYPGLDSLEGKERFNAVRATGSFDPADYDVAYRHLRPKMVNLIQCKRVLLEGVTFQNPPNWTLHPALCEDVSVLNVTVRAKYSAQNSDALDLESCRRVVVRGCTFDVGDDGICLKSFKDAPGRRIGVPTEDVLIEDCVVFHAHGGLTIGSEMSGGIRNVQVNNCLFMGTDIGLRFKTTRGRGGVVENIRISNINMIDIPGNAINFNMYYGGKSLPEGELSDLPPVTEETPQFRDIHIENVVCRGAKAAIFLQGLPEMPIRNITLKNVSISSHKGVSVMDADGIDFENVQVDHQSGPVLTEVRVNNSRLEVK